MGNIKYSHGEFVEYIREYPAFIGEIFTLLGCYDLSRVKNFFKNVDLTKPYSKIPEHVGYINNKSDVHKIISSPYAYNINPNVIDQDYMDDEHTIKIYSETVERFDEVVNKYLPPVPREEAINLANLQSNDDVVEFGIGPGSNFEFYPRFCNIVGIDISPASVNAARNKIDLLGLHNISAEIMDIHGTEFLDNRFDKVLSICALCVVRNPFKAMKEVKRISKPDSRIVLYEPFISPVEEVNMLLYLVQPIGREIGGIWFDNFPPYTIPYNCYFDLFKILEELEFEVETEKVFDPPYNTIFLLTCRNKK